MDKKIHMTAEIQQLIEQSIAQGNDSWFSQAEIHTALPTDHQSDELGLGVRFKDGSSYAITIKRMDDIVTQ